MIKAKVAGIDLAAKNNRCSGYAVIELTNNYATLTKLKCLYMNDEIVNEVVNDGVSLVAIDAPITNNPTMREVDREMIRRGFRVFPPSFKWMKSLSLRAYSIYSKLISLGINVIETHPRSSLLNVGINDVNELLRLFNVLVKISDINLKHKDLRDATISALVALCILKNCVDVVSSYDGKIYLLRRPT